MFDQKAYTYKVKYSMMASKLHDVYVTLIPIQRLYKFEARKILKSQVHTRSYKEFWNLVNHES